MAENKVLQAEALQARLSQSGGWPTREFFSLITGNRGCPLTVTPLRRLTVASHKTRVGTEVVTTFSSFQVP